MKIDEPAFNRGVDEVLTLAPMRRAIKHAVTRAQTDMGLERIRSGEFFGMKQERK